MDEQEFLHRISVAYNINIELLKDLIHDEGLLTLIKAGKSRDAILYISKAHPILGLFEAKKIVEAFSKEFN